MSLSSWTTLPNPTAILRRAKVWEEPIGRSAFPGGRAIPGTPISRLASGAPAELFREQFLRSFRGTGLVGIDENAANVFSHVLRINPARLQGVD